MHQRLRFSLLAALLASQLGSALAQEAVAPSNGLSPAACAVTPMPRVKEYEWMSVAQWREIHAAQRARAQQGGIDLMFVGDSITQGWPKDLFEQAFGRFHAANFGIGGDHTGNVLYRLDDPVMAQLKPRAIVLLVGVNNFFHCGDDTAQTFAGIRQVVATLRREYPDARILLNAVLPYGEANEAFKRAQVRALNRMVATLADGEHVLYRDYGPRLLQPDGTISSEIMADHLHPTAKGYQLWAEAMLPDVEQLMHGASASETVRADDARIARMGRTAVEADGTLRFGYAGVTLALAVDGSRLDMEAAGGSANSLVDVVVDGGAPVTLRLEPQLRSYALFKDAAPGPHRVELVHRTETWQGVVSVARFTTDGRLLAAPALPSRKLLVMGDSVTCGTAMERGEGDQDTPGWWNARVSYGMLLGQALHAQVQLVCYGGRGLVRSWNGHTDEYQLPAFYELAIADAAHPVKWKQADYAPDLILVAIGTNDFNQGIPERAAYVDAYTAFVRTLLRDHPRAQIALTEGAMLDGDKKAALTAYIAETVARVGDARVHAVASMHHPGDAANAHPTTAQHAAMARELAPPLRALMAW